MAEQATYFVTPSLLVGEPPDWHFPATPVNGPGEALAVIRAGGAALLPNVPTVWEIVQYVLEQLGSSPEHATRTIAFARTGELK